ncbi:AmmeMemoRadiSam system radical SAM enzyme [Ruminococcus sp. FC2018]|uniref:AmmeMemoRadiSam system radical SAM enzyme n=1 Tax=Ruminococcus sp. FC2018 TaxID=1410617 RepID=UPI00048AF0D3|nr:AmmeMemoRadiSam system radical SAM enzyme [Ruminococcus sp. FC2018]
MAICEVCFRHCSLEPGQVGFCGARIGSGSKVTAKNYGVVSAVALDPIEKKPLNRFFPGSMILSVGSCGCNMRCRFCQNYEISWSQQAMDHAGRWGSLTPGELVQLAEGYKDRGNIGVAFTYNEPLVGYEFVRDTARLVKQAGMKTVLVTNGCAEEKILEQLSGHIDAMNIDLKCFNRQTYKEQLGGDLETVKRFIAGAVKFCHVELTTLVVPGISDDPRELDAMTDWIASLEDAQSRNVGADIPLHLNRFFPRFKMTDCRATDIGVLKALADRAAKKLKYVYTGNC